MRTRVDIDIDAPGRTVFELARDVSRWPVLLPHYRKVTMRSHGGTEVATMQAVRSVGRWRVPVAWRSRTWAEDNDPDDLRLRFVHVGGASKGMDVTWHITPRGPGSHVVIEHDFTRHLPLVGDELFPRIVDRLFVHPIASQTLATFKRLAERARASGGEP
jgi:ribosome-associated toxin RatA of RatAB toxin-antitoxin module